MSTATVQDRAKALEQRAGEDYPESWRPDQGEHPQHLTGTIVGYDTADTAYGKKTIVVLEDTDGKRWSVWLIHAALLAAVARERPKIGELVLVAYQGKKTSAGSGREYHAYRVELDRSKAEPDFDQLAADAGIEPRGDAGSDIPSTFETADTTAPDEDDSNIPF